MHTLDFGDDVAMGCNVFNMCPLYGMADPGKLWWEKRNGATLDPRAIALHTGILATALMKNTGDSNWKCLVEWGVLDGLCEDEKEANVKGGATLMMEKMAAQYSDGWRTWPIVGCGRKFRPWRNGCSMVVELDEKGQGNPKDFVAMVADRLPELVDNAVKKARWTTLRKFMQKSKNVHDLFKLIPVTLPMTHRLIGPGNVETTGISQFPIQKWEELRKPKMTTSMWYKLVLTVAPHTKKRSTMTRLMSLRD